MMTLKKSGALRRKTNLRPVMRNDTRWSSTFMMVELYILLKDFLDVNDPELIPLLLSPSDNATVLSLLKDLENFESVSKEFQKEDISYLKIRLLFDSLVEDYPTLDNNLSPNGQIVHSTVFEKSLSKYMQNRNLDEKETAVLEKHLVKNSIKELEAPMGSSFVEEVYAKKLRNIEAGPFGNLSWIAPTCNRAERLFSIAKYVLNNYRKRLLPCHVESQLFSIVNQLFWDVFTVQRMIN